MRAFMVSVTLVLGLVSFRPAWACGGGFGEVEVNPSQNILVIMDQGTERYVLSPNFCGKSADFGLVLPVPAALSDAPALAGEGVFAELAELTKARVETEEVCGPAPMGCGAAGAADDDDGTLDTRSTNGGVEVVQAGTVGQFDWSLLQARTSTELTQWLTANHYPYEQSSVPLFTYYVDKNWYFVVFKVSTDRNGVPATSTLCGDLGPITLSFPATVPVVPARITAAVTPPSNAYWYSSTLVWRVYLFADQRLTLTGNGSVENKLEFAGAFSDADVANSPGVRALDVAHAKLTRLELTFNPVALVNDLEFTADPDQADYRKVNKVKDYVLCGGCDSTVPVLGEWGLLGLGLFLATGGMRRRLRRPAES